MVFFQRHVARGSLDMMPERDGCYPGNVVSGMLLHLEQPLYDTVLSIALVGHEDLNAVYTDDESDKYAINGLHLLVDQRIQLGQGPLTAGDHVIPFSIPVPPVLPATKNTQYFTELLDRTKSDLRLQIRYALQCYLTVRDVGVQSLQQELLFTILAYPAVRPIGAPLDASTTRDFRYACLMRKGSCTLRIAVPSNVVSVGGLISAHVWLTLSPTERLRSVKLSLARKIVANVNDLRRQDGASVAICTTPFDWSLLRDLHEFVLQLPVTDASAPQVAARASAFRSIRPRRSTTLTWRTRLSSSAACAVAARLSCGFPSHWHRTMIGRHGFLSPQRRDRVARHSTGERDVLAGDAVAGTVLLRLSRALADAVVTIKLAGREVVTVYYTDSEGDTSSNSALRRLINLEAPLMHGPLVAGNLSVPFSIPLPPNLLPTTERQYINMASKFSTKTDSRLKIEYLVECKLSTRDLNAQSLKQTVPLTVVAWPAAVPIGAPAEAHTACGFRYAFWPKA